MSIIRLPIDTKSLHCNIKNDNKIGHTATVATPLRQGNSYDHELGRLFEIPKYKGFDSNLNLINEINKNARTQIKVLGVFLFEDIAVNGIRIKTDKQYCIYVREEIDPTKYQCGRIKVHYPMGFRYEDDELNVDNRSVMRDVSAHLQGYAFLTTAFEYDTETRVLNFRVSIVGEPQVPYSKVFVNEKGVGNKFVLAFSDLADHYDSEAIALRQYGEEVSPINYIEVMEKYRAKAMTLAAEYLKTESGVTAVRAIGSDYPYAPCDFEFVKDNITRHAQVFFTATAEEYFSLSAKRVAFNNAFADKTILLLFTNIAKEPKMYQYTMQEANCFRKDIALIVYTREDDDE